MRIEILCLLHFCRPGFRTLHIPPWSSLDLQVLRICRSQRLDMGPKRVMWVRRYQGQCRALRPLGHQGCRLRNHNKDQPLCSGYTPPPPCPKDTWRPHIRRRRSPCPKGGVGTLIIGALRHIRYPLDLQHGPRGSKIEKHRQST